MEGGVTWGCVTYLNSKNFAEISSIDCSVDTDNVFLHDQTMADVFKVTKEEIENSDMILNDIDEHGSGNNQDMKIRYSHEKLQHAEIYMVSPFEVYMVDCIVDEEDIFLRDHTMVDSTKVAKEEIGYEYIILNNEVEHGIVSMKLYLIQVRD